MNINLDKPDQILRNILLQDDDVVSKVSNTDQWLSDGTLTATVSINGVEVGAESFEASLNGMLQSIEDHYKRNYGSVQKDADIEKRAEELLKEHADDVLDKLADLMYILERSSNLIKPHWER